MNWLDTENRYGLVSRVLHWSMAVLVLFLLASDWWMEALEELGKANLMGLHKSLGIALLVLLVFRLAWRWHNHGRVAPPAHWRRAARLGHLALYLLLLAIPVSGVLTAWGSGHGVAFFGLPLIPAGPEIEWIEEAFEETHEVLANLMWLLIGGHVIAALAHQWWLGERSLKRMA
ncbi:cytochrome b [Halomonas sp. MCCC 1A17488]|uniref:Cytochrome b n=1 Tax=Billgrantia sulfidoxydans TaxID=2733484 RepID=A0ABX7W394_9GAMM|nr:MULTISPECIES: cytochrome b [Halomonas]MCE8016183.1 cytochrome b [Halomonas sp. MCCC 1A17488]MCG3239516.1 cytochrome b [Halomonas sp. MCCC 1A17488]QPP50563.1 cytochrome b [Halomonas sp. SS10-MC5]QTP54150.1 cytochrome b [Halomonas sulfidoxydans]